MSNDFSMHQLLPRSPQACRNIIYKNAKPELKKAMIEIAIASGLEEADCNNRKFMTPADDSVASNLWEEVLTNLDQYAKLHYKREHKGRGIYMGQGKRVPGPKAAFDHIEHKLPSNRSSNSAYAQILKHLISDIASRFNAVGQESQVKASADRFRRCINYFGLINKIEVSNVPDEAVDTHFSRIVETNSTNDEISTLVRQLYCPATDSGEGAAGGEEVDEAGEASGGEDDGNEKKKGEDETDDKTDAEEKGDGSAISEGMGDDDEGDGPANGDEENIDGVPSKYEEDLNRLQQERSGYHVTDHDAEIAAGESRSIGRNYVDDLTLPAVSNDRKLPANPPGNKNNGEYHGTSTWCIFTILTESKIENITQSLLLTYIYNITQSQPIDVLEYAQFLPNPNL